MDGARWSMGAFRRRLCGEGEHRKQNKDREDRLQAQGGLPDQAPPGPGAAEARVHRSRYHRS
jgi:hypothetical protein